MEINSKLYLKDPASTSLGIKILHESVELIRNLGYENFTFKKLAIHIASTEASIYRYFKNKHRLLLYLMSFYWNLIDDKVLEILYSKKETNEKIQELVNLLSELRKINNCRNYFIIESLFEIFVKESSKVYFTSNVEHDNSRHFFKPYIDLCNNIALIFLEKKPNYIYSSSLASMVIESTHLQYFFINYLPSLTNFKNCSNQNSYLREFLTDLIKKNLE